MRGRKPVPNVLREIRGNPSKLTRAARHEPKIVGDLSDPPDHFTEEQKTAWRYVLSHSPPGLLKLIDRAALAAFIAAEDLHRQAMIEQSKGRLLWRPPGSSQPQQSPYLPIINRQALIMLKAAEQLGFTPVSRPRVFAGAQPAGPGLNAISSKAKPRGRSKEPVSLDAYLASAPPRPTIN
jgi:P27 family predicted phage terminase small subunit